MYDGSIPTSRLITLSLWMATTGLVVAAWVTAFFVHDDTAHLIGYTACCLSAAAAVSHVRCIVMKATRYATATINRGDPPPAGRVYPID